MFQSSTWADWLKNLMADPMWGYYRGVNLISWIIAIGLMYGIGIVFWSRSKKEGVIPSQARFLQSFSLLFFLMGVTRIVFVFSYFVEPYYNLLLALGYAFAALSLLPLIITIEKWSLPQTHKIFTILGVVICVLSFYFVFDSTQSEVSLMIQTIGMPFMFGVFVILYIWVIKLSTGTVRKKAILALIGAFVFGLGVILDSESLIESVSIIMYFAPIVFAAGEIILGVSQKVD